MVIGEEAGSILHAQLLEEAGGGLRRRYEREDERRRRDRPGAEVGAVLRRVREVPNLTTFNSILRAERECRGWIYLRPWPTHFQHIRIGPAARSRSDGRALRVRRVQPPLAKERQGVREVCKDVGPVRGDVTRDTVCKATRVSGGMASAGQEAAVVAYRG